MGLTIYGSPWQPQYNSWAFNLPRDSDELYSKWAQIPNEVDVLVTHCPPLGVHDMLNSGEMVGCPKLLKEVVQRVRPKLHLFGHVHEGNFHFNCLNFSLLAFTNFFLLLTTKKSIDGYFFLPKKADASISSIYPNFLSLYFLHVLRQSVSSSSFDD